MSISHSIYVGPYFNVKILDNELEQNKKRFFEILYHDAVDQLVLPNDEDGSKDNVFHLLPNKIIEIYNLSYKRNPYYENRYGCVEIYPSHMKFEKEWLYKEYSWVVDLFSSIASTTMSWGIVGVWR